MNKNHYIRPELYQFPDSEVFLMGANYVLCNSTASATTPEFVYDEVIDL